MYEENFNIQKGLEKMERYNTIILDWKIHHCKNINSPLSYFLNLTLSQ